MDNKLKQDVTDDKAVRGIFNESGFFAVVAKLRVKEK